MWTFSQPQAALNRVLSDDPPALRRPGVLRLEIDTCRENVRWLTKIPRWGGSATANASSAVPPSATPGGCAPGAVRRRRCPAAACANPAPRRSVSPPAPAMRSSGPPASRSGTLARRAPTSGNAPAGRRPSASPKGCARSVARRNLRPIVACASPAERNAGPPNVPATPGVRPPANYTAEKIRRCVAGSRGRKASSASMHASTPGFARDAATVPSSKAARHASRAVTSGARPSGSSMPPGGRRAGARDAASPRSAAPRDAAPAPCSRPGAIRTRTPPAAGAMPAGGITLHTTPLLF